MSFDSQQNNALIQLGRWLQAENYRFTTVTPCTHARVNRRPSAQWAKSLRDVFGWSRPYLPGALPPQCLELMRRAGIEEPIAGADGEGARSGLRVSSLDDLLLYHSAFPTDAADSVFFGPDTYRFAGAIRRMLAEDSCVQRAADIGCGSGAGAILVSRLCPAAQVFALDINPSALALCRVNAALAGVDRVQAMQSDLLNGLPGSFDLIIANPPYLIDPAVRAYRHGGGARGEGLSLAIVEQALSRLAPGGRLLLYTGVAIVDGLDPFKEWLGDRLQGEALDWRYEELDPDVFGEELDQPQYEDVDRLAAVCLQVRKRS